jgi:hypothetical protein
MICMMIANMYKHIGAVMVTVMRLMIIIINVVIKINLISITMIDVIISKLTTSNYLSRMIQRFAR